MGGPQPPNPDMSSLPFQVPPDILATSSSVPTVASSSSAHILPAAQATSAHLSNDNPSTRYRGTEVGGGSGAPSQGAVPEAVSVGVPGSTLAGAMIAAGLPGSGGSAVQPFLDQGIHAMVVQLAAQMDSLKVALGQGAPAASGVLPVKPPLGRTGKKPNTNQLNVHVNDPHHEAHPEHEAVIEYMGGGDDSLSSTNSARILALIGSLSVFHDRGGNLSLQAPGTPKSSRMDEYWIALYVAYGNLLTDDVDDAFAPGTYQRVVIRFAMGRIKWLYALKQALVFHYQPTMEWSGAHAYLLIVVKEEYRGVKFNRQNQQHMYLLGLVTDERLAEMKGSVVFDVPNPEVIDKAKHVICDWYLRRAGLLDAGIPSAGGLSGGSGGQGVAVGVVGPVSELLKRASNSHCFLCLDPICKGYAKTGFHCKNPVHRNMIHKACGHRHVWDNLGGPRSTRCDEGDEVWPPTGAQKAADKGKTVPSPKAF